MLGILGLENYKIRCIIGVHPFERTHEQDIYIDLKVEANMAACVESDQIYDTVCYAQLAKICADIAWEGQFQLLEAYANEVLSTLMENFSINWAWIRVKKPVPDMSGSFVMIELSKQRVEQHEMDTSHRGRQATRSRNLHHVIA